MLILRTAIALMGGYALAASFFFARGLRARPRALVLVALACLLLPCPMLIPGHWVVARVLVATTLALFLMDMWDMHCDSERGRRFSFGQYLSFLLNHGWMVSSETDSHHHQRPLKRRLMELTAWSLAFVGSVVLLVVIFRADWQAHSFFIEHSVKVVAATWWLICAFSVYGAAWRVAGMRSYPFGGNVLLAHCPAEFWRRWNRPVHRWLTRRIFLPVGGRKHPLRATLVVFCVSGLLHEYLISVSLERLSGCMLGFFVLQGIAAAATLRFRPNRWSFLPAVALTLAFNVASATLLFAAVNGVVPFYVNEVPLLNRGVGSPG